MDKQKILIFTGKFPAFGNDTDGGSILIYTLIEALKDCCTLDVLFTRRFNKKFEFIDGVNDVYFETYKYHPNNKFERRLINKEQIFNKLKSIIDNYDKVIITHVSKAFGIEKLNNEQKKKIILFPMFLTSSYKKSKEVVPEIYTKLEYDVLNNVGCIYTPSLNEKNDMINEYNVYGGKIKVIPRGYSSLIKYRNRIINNVINVLYIGSIKKQKNQLDSLIIIKQLIDKGFNIKLHLVGGIQDDEVYNDCINYINDNNLKNNVIFHGILNQKELAIVIDKCDINISTSNWETYGRGIFEGMAGGLPTIIYDNIECVKQYLSNNNGIIFVKNIDEFVSSLIKLIEDKQYYQNMSLLAHENVKSLSQIEETNKFKTEFIKQKILIVLGTRPEAIKLIPIIEQLKLNGIPFKILNTNQHSYLIDEVLKLNNIECDYKLNIFGLCNSLEDTKKEMLKQMNEVLISSDYKIVIVQGDTLSAYIGSIFGKNNNIDVAYVEAGLRTFDINNPYPEEMYRLEITKNSKYFFCPSIIEKNNLINEGINNHIYVTGNTFVDYRIKNNIEIEVKNKVLITIHRRENIEYLDTIFFELKNIASKYKDIEIIFPVHPNPLIIEKVNAILGNINNIKLIDPLEPDDFYNHLLSSLLIISDSGGVQEECILNCKKMIVLRNKTERNVDFDFIKLVKPSIDSLYDAFVFLINKKIDDHEKCYFYGNGNASKRICEILKEEL